MGKNKQTTLSIVGVGWYTPEAWEKLRAIAEDPDTLDTTYKEWLQQAKHTCRMLKQKGFHVLKVHLDIDELAAWCTEHGLAVNGGARARFIAEKVHEQSTAAGEVEI